MAYENVLEEQISVAKVPDTDENMKLIKAAQCGDSEAMNEVVIRNGRLVLGMLKRYSWLPEMREDLLQEGLIGIQEAVERFDFSYQTKFSTYAVFWIQQAMNKYVISHANTVSIPYALIRRAREIKALEDNAEMNGLPPLKDSDIAETLGIDESEVVNARMYTRSAVSLDMAIDEETDVTLGDTIPMQYSIEDEVAGGCTMNILMDTAKEILTSREYEFIKMRYGIGEYAENPRTYSEIGECNGMTKQNVGRIISRAMKRLRNAKAIQELAV